MEISLEASWVGVQRHGQDLADRLAQGFSGLLLHAHPPQLPPWSPPALLPPKLAIPIHFDIDLPVVPFVGGARRGGEVDLPAAAVSSLVEIGGRLGQAGYELGAAVQQLARQVPVPLPFRSEGARRGKWEAARPLAAVAADDGEVALAAGTVGHTTAISERVADMGSLEVAAAAAAAATGSATSASASGVGAGGADGDGSDEEEDGFECEIGTLDNLKKAKVCTIDWLELDDQLGLIDTFLPQTNLRRFYLNTCTGARFCSNVFGYMFPLGELSYALDFLMICVSIACAVVLIMSLMSVMSHTCLTRL
jgi:hypothetical protein